MDYNPDILKYRKVQDISGAYPNTGTVFTLLNNIGTGSDFNQRIGRSIQMKAMRLRFRSQPMGIVNDQGNLRIILVYDRQNNGTTPVITDILQSNSTLSNELFEKNQRFMFIKDWLFAVPRYDTNATPVATSPCFQDKSFIQFDEYINLDLPTVYFGTGGSQIATGALFIVTLFAPTPVFFQQCSFTNRIYFED